MAVWLDLAPFVKIAIWTWLWFVPTSEVVRGRVLTWIDVLGKWSLVSFFSLCIISVGFVFNSTLYIPLPLPGDEAVAIKIDVHSVPGYGSMSFIVALVWSILLGNLMLELHVRAKHWEEFRRASAVTRQTSSPSSDVNDTPFLVRAAGQALSTRQRSTSRSIPFAGLLGDLVRQTSFQVLESVTASNAPDEPAETLWQRTYEFPPPVGKRRFSLSGVIFVALWLAALLATALLGMLLPSIGFLRTGAVPSLLMSADEARLHLSIPAMMDRIVRVGSSVGEHNLAGMYIFTAMVVPLIHIGALAGMWLLPFTPVRQRQWFRFVEFVSAWSAIDVGVVALFVSWIGLENISSTIVEVVVPGLTAAVRVLAPSEKDVMVIHPSLETGFWWLLAASVLEKLLAHFLLELSAVCIAQRSVKERDVDGVGSAGAVSTHTPRQLHPDELMQFSPAGRYAGVSALPEGVFYAGLPIKGFWNVMVAAGFLVKRDDAAAAAGV